MTTTVTAPLPAAVRTVAAVLVQTSAYGLPDADGGWTTQRFVRFDGGSEGVATIIGEATLVQDFGVVMPQGGTDFAAVGIAPDIGRRGTTSPLIGRVVRVLKQDGGSTAIDGKGYTPFWWGRIVSSRWTPDRAGRTSGGRMTWQAVGIASALDQIALNRGKVLAAAGGTVCDLGYLPAFNGQPGGDRSTSTVTVNGRSVYVHDLANATSGNTWTARQIVEHLLAVGTIGDPSRNASSQSDGTHFGWNIAMGTVGTLLDWAAPSLDLSGMTLFQALNAIVSRKRALVLKLTVTGSTILVNVYSGSGTSIGIRGFILPASTYTSSLDADDALWLADLEVVQDQSSTYDGVEVRGGFPWVGISVAYSGAGSGQLLGVGYGWSAPQETVWAANPWSSIGDHVWRLFDADPAWDGYSYDRQGSLTNQSGSAGNRTVSTAAPAPSRVIAGERVLPCSVGFSTLLVGPRQSPVVVVTEDGSFYDDLSQQVTVEVHSDPLAVTVDDGQQGGSLRDRLANSTARMIVTLGVREYEPLRVFGTVSEPSSPTPSIKSINLPNLELWRVPKGTVTGVDQSGALTTLAADITIRDDTHILTDVFNLAVAWFTQPTYLVHWTDRVNLDIGDTYAPGRLLTSVVLSDTSIGLYGVIMRRRWVPIDRDGVRCIDTAYETERFIPDIEAVL